LKYPVFDPDITSEDMASVADALSKGEISGNFGSYLEGFEDEFAKYCGVSHGVAVTSGTTALHLAVAVLDLDPGDEILISSSTNIATALAVIHNNLIPIPIDSERESWNIDLNLLEQSIGPRTRAIIPVHLFGRPIQMEQLMEIANKHNLIVIEDCAESHGATVNGKMTGSFGQMGCFSFYANKIITTGEGGMIVTDDQNLAKKLRKFRNLGFGEPRFVHEVAGYNFRMTGYQAALGLSQTKRIEQIVSRKIEIADMYTSTLEENEFLVLPTAPSWAKHVHWMYAVYLSKFSPVSRDELLKTLKFHDIETRTFFCPMNLQPILMQKFKMRSCPIAEDIWNQGFYLPSSTKLNEKDIRFISTKINEILS
jgi:perosamine synthetase